MTLVAQDLVVTGRIAGATLALRPGELVAICGPNGAGKSSLLAALAGLLAPDAGTLTLGGKALASLPRRERAQAIGYLPQVQDIAWDVDVATLAGLGRLPWRAGARADCQAVAAALAALDLTQFAARPVSRLSGGERERALLARVLAGTPRWILADEPLAALDLAHQAALLRHFRALVEQGLGVVLVLHDLARSVNAADRVIVVEGGRIVADGLPGVALDPGTIARVWGVRGEWLGPPGARAFSVTL